MNEMEIQYGSSMLSDCKQYAKAIRAEMVNIATGFIRIGYLLRKSRDTGMVIAGGYKNMEEFAKAEFNMDKSAVSRFVSINEKYSEGGYSDRLRKKYEGYTYSSLAEMLNLPEHIAEVIQPEHTREQIRDIKAEIREEEKITEIELMQEPKKERYGYVADTMAKEFMFHWLGQHDMAELYVRLYSLVRKDAREAYEAIAPSGIATYFVRIPQVGKLMVSMTGYDKDVCFRSLRDSSAENISVSELMEIIAELMPEENYEPEQIWEMVYGEQFPANHVVDSEPGKKKTDNEQGKKTKPEQKEKKKEEKTASSVLNSYSDGNSENEESEDEKEREEYQQEDEESQVSDVVAPAQEDKEDLLKVQEYADNMVQYVKEQRWQQALWSIRDLNDLVTKMRDKAKVIDIPGQMSFGEDNEDEE